MWPTCLSSPGERIGLLPISFFFSFPLCSLLIEKTNQQTNRAVRPERPRSRDLPRAPCDGFLGAFPRPLCYL